MTRIIHSIEQNFGSEDFRIPISTFICERFKKTAKPFLPLLSDLCHFYLSGLPERNICFSFNPYPVEHGMRIRTFSYIIISFNDTQSLSRRLSANTHPWPLFIR